VGGVNTFRCGIPVHVAMEAIAMYPTSDQIVERRIKWSLETKLDVVNSKGIMQGNL
jgi:hypothetical protein